MFTTFYICLLSLKVPFSTIYIAFLIILETLGIQKVVSIQPGRVYKLLIMTRNLACQFRQNEH